MKDVENKLKVILDNSNYNKKQLANELQVSPSQITRWLAGALPRLDNNEKLDELYKKYAV